MITFKQAEALYWIAKLGNFESAANKLHMSQSAISKRIIELEHIFAIEIFDRSHRNALLTEKGKELLVHVQDLLNKRDTLIECLSTKEILVKDFRIGITELIALTWMPKLIEAIGIKYPKVRIELTVESSKKLHKKLLLDQLDMVISPYIITPKEIISTHLATVKNAWMCAPSLAKENHQLQQMTQYPVLLQGVGSAVSAYYDHWLDQQNIRFNHTIFSDSILAQIGLVLSGTGISHLPLQCFEYLVKEGLLSILQTDAPLPPVQYTIFYHSSRTQGLNLKVVELAQQLCDFSKLLLNVHSNKLNS